MPEASELKGRAISDSAAIVERIESVLARIETVMATREAESARLRRVEAAAAAALADLDALIESAPAIASEPRARGLG